MSSGSSTIEMLFGSMHRAVLGGLVGIIALVSIGVAMRAFPSGNYLQGGGISAIFAVGAVAWIGYLFLEGYRGAT